MCITVLVSLSKFLLLIYTLIFQFVSARIIYILSHKKYCYNIQIQKMNQQAKLAIQSCFASVMDTDVGSLGEKEKQAIHKICDLFQNPEIHPIQIQRQIKKTQEFDFQWDQIKALYFKFVECDIIFNLLGLLVLRPWIRYRVMQALDLKLSEQEPMKVLDKFYSCQGNQLQQIIRQAIRAQYGQDDDDVYKDCAKIFEDYPKQVMKLRQLSTPVIAPVSEYVDKSIKETFQDMLSDYQKYPRNSFIKSLQRQIIHHYIKENQASLEQFKNKIDYQTFGQSKMEELMVQFSKEYKGNQDIQITQKFKEILKIPDQKTKKKGKQLTPFSHLSSIKDKILPVNVYQIKRLIQKTLQAKQKIANKNGLLLIGGSGSGKSTCILKLLGYNLIQTTSANGLYTLAPSQDLLQEHKSFHTSPDPRSCTRYINSSRISKKMFKIGTSEQKTDLVIIDSPGTNDSGGAQIDAANCLGMLLALYECRSIRLVIIIQRDSLYGGQKMEGAVNLSRTVSNLFSDLAPILQRTTILFNKFHDKKDIDQLPKILQLKIKQLLRLNQGDEKLISFLEFLSEQAQKQQNFIYPVKQDFQPLVQRITRKIPISQKDIRQYLQYSFSNTTKSKIESFISICLLNIKDKFRQSKYEQVSFYYQMLSELKKLISTNEMITRKRQDANIFITEQIKNKIKNYGKLFRQVQNQNTSPTVYQDIKNCEKDINQVLKYQDSLLIQSIESQLTVIKKTCQDNLLAKLKKSTKQTSKNLLKVIQKYILQISPGFKSITCSQIERLYNQQKKLFDQMLNNESYEKICQTLNSLKYLSQTYKIYEPLNNTQCNYQSQKLNLKQKIQLLLNNQTNHEKSLNSGFIQQMLINDINQNLQKLKIVEKIGEQIMGYDLKSTRDTFLNNVEAKIDEKLRQLLTFVDKSSEKKPSESRLDRGMTKMKQSIDLIRKIDNLKQKSQRQYDRTFRQIDSRFEETIRQLTQILHDLRRNNDIKFVTEKLEDYIKYRQFTIRCFQISGLKTDKQHEVIQELDQKVQQFLKRQLNILKSLTINPDMIGQQTKITIYQWCQKLSIFERMQKIDKLSAKIQQITSQFNTIVTNPLNNLKQQIFHLQEQDDKKLIYSLETIQSICAYLITLYDIFNKTSYNQGILKESELDIKNLFTARIQSLKQKSFNFLSNSNTKQQLNEQYKDAIILLSQIFHHKSISSYLIQYNQFNPGDLLKRIQIKLRQLSEIVDKEFKDIQHEQNSEIVAKIILMKKICESFKYIEENLSKNYVLVNCFSSVLEKINQFWNSRQRDYKQSLKMYIQQLNKLRIQSLPYFNNIFEIYQQHKEDIQMIKNIHFSLYELSRNCNQKLKKLKSDVETQGLYFSDISRTKSALQFLAVALQMQKQLKKFSSNDNSGIRKIEYAQKQNLEFLSSKLSNVLQTQVQKVLNGIRHLDMSKCEANIDNIGQLQTTIIRYFSKNGNQGSIIEKKYESCKTQCRQQLKKIEIQMQQDCHLRQSLNVLFMKESSKIDKLYMTYGPNFKVDNQFTKFYDNVSSNINKKNVLQENLKAYFSDRFLQLTEKSNSTQDQFNKIKEQITGSLQNTPYKLANQYKRQLKQIIHKLQQRQASLIVEAVKKITEEPAQFSQFFNLLNVSSSNSNKIFEQKLKLKFQELCQEKSKTTYSIKSKMEFINIYFINNGKKFKEMIQKNNVIKEVMDKNYNFCTEDLLKIIEKQLYTLQNKLKSMNPMISQSKIGINISSTSVQQFLQSFSSIIKFASSLQDTSLINGTKDQKSIKKLLLNCTRSLYNEYQQKLTILQTKAVFNDINFMKAHEFLDFKKHIYNLKENYALLEVVKNQLNHIQMRSFFTDQQQVQLIEKIVNDAEISEKLSKYRNQIKSMKQEVQKYVFYNDIKKNYIEKHFQQDIKEIQERLQFLQENKAFLDQYILLETQKYQMKELYQAILEKFIILFKKCIEDLKNIVGNFNYEVVQEHQKIFLKFCNEISNRKFRAFDKQVAIEKEKQITQFVKQSYNELQKKLKELISLYKTSKDQHDKDIKQFQKQQQSKKLQAINQSFKIKKIKSQIVEYENNKKNQMSKQDDAIKKENINKQMKTELQNKNNAIDEEIQAINEKIKKQYTEKKEQQRSKLKIIAMNIGQLVIVFQKILFDIDFDRSKYKQKFTVILNEIKNHGNKSLINSLIEYMDHLEKDINGVGKHVLNNYEIFANYKNKKRNELTRGNDINYVTKYLKMTGKTAKQVGSQIQSIKSLYQIQFLSQYNKIIKMYEASPKQQTIQVIVRKCKDKGKDLKNLFYFNTNQNTRYGQNKIHLLSYIFGLWTILKSQMIDDQVQYSIQPHPAQIATLMLLLGISSNKQQIQNRFAQVLTGEGKSLILGGLSCYLALVGYKVKCACYSVYLSGRDWKSFSQLFSYLNIEDQISYNTFNVLCQNILNSGQKSFSQNISQYINKQLGILEKIKQNFKSFVEFFVSSNVSIQSSNQILIIDELDVFFDKNYFGTTYCPSIQLKDQSINQLFMYIYDKAKNNAANININDILKSNQLKKVIQKYSNLQQIIKNQVHGMVAAALNFKHQYFIIDSKIVYKDNDTISPKLSYGYRTVFANIYQHQRGMVSTSNCLQAMKISLIASQFSYAKLPKYFKNILGVTGTLAAMPAFKKQKLETDYQIVNQFEIPSAFGMDVRRKQKYSIVQDQRFYSSIIQDINSIKDGRPIIIFFRNALQMNQFFNSQEFSPYIKKSFCLTQEHDANTRDTRILKATDANKLTLMTDSFGRGTDFILHNKKLLEAGGLHVIQAFLSLEESDQIQIKGRTARQKNPGSYHCIINEKQLQELGLKKQSFQLDSTPEQIHKILLDAREIKNTKEKNITQQNLKAAQIKHEKILKVFQDQNISQSSVISYLFEINNCPQITFSTKAVKTILGIDATGSMSQTLSKVCLIIQKSFVQVYDILRSKDIKEGVEIKIVFYRNYSSLKEKIIESSAFENKADNLNIFSRKITASGGQGNQAIQVFLQTVNNQTEVDQVIIIGDAPCNEDFQVNKKRSIKEQNYWNPQYPKTTYKQQLDKIIAKNIPIHSFYLAADKFFEQLSKKTNGESSPFNVYAQTAAGDLTQFIVKNILKIIGKNKKPGTTEQLIRAYMEKYGNQRIY